MGLVGLLMHFQPGTGRPQGEQGLTSRLQDCCPVLVGPLSLLRLVVALPVVGCRARRWRSFAVIVIDRESIVDGVRSPSARRSPETLTAA